MIKDYIGTPALLEQFAEECTELAQASLKYARKLRNENPTTRHFSEIINHFQEEIADIFVCIDELESAHLIDHRYISEIKELKINRWYEIVKQRRSD